MPTLNFPPAHIEAKVDSAATKYTRRVDIYQADGTTIWKAAVPVTAGRITVDQTRPERRTAEFTFMNLGGELTIHRDTGLWYDKVIVASMGVKHPSGNWETRMGTFLIDRITTDYDVPAVHVTCRDFTKKLVGSKLPTDTAFPRHTQLETIIDTIAAAGGVANRNLPVTSVAVDPGEDILIQQGTERWDAIYRLASDHGYDLYLDPDAVLQMTPFEDPYTAASQYSFRTGASSNLASIGRQVNDSLIRNHIVVAGKTPGDVPVWAQAFNMDPNSPTNIDRLGQRTHVYESSWVTSTTQARDVAERQLKMRSLEQYEADLETIIAPWLDVGVVVDFVDPKATPGDPTKYLLSQLTYDWDLKPLSAVVRRVTNVIERAPLWPDTSLYPDTNIFPGA